MSEVPLSGDADSAFVEQAEFLALGGVGIVSAVLAPVNIPLRWRSQQRGCSSLPLPLTFLADPFLDCRLCSIFSAISVFGVLCVYAPLSLILSFRVAI
jgi:hypothetical protein